MSTVVAAAGAVGPASAVGAVATVVVVVVVVVVVTVTVTVTATAAAVAVAAAATNAISTSTTGYTSSMHGFHPITTRAIICTAAPLQCVKCYRGGRKTQFIPSISKIQSRKCYHCFQYTKRHLMTL